MNYKLLDNLREEDLTPDLKLLLGASDMETIKKLIYHLQSTQFYIPKIAMLTSFVARCAEENPENKSIRELALEIGVSRRFLENTLKARRKCKFDLLKKSSDPIKIKRISIDKK